MSARTVTRIVSLTLIVSLVFPAALLAIPKTVSAQSSGGSSTSGGSSSSGSSSSSGGSSSPGCVVGLAAGLASVTTNLFKSVNTGDSPTGAASFTSAGSTVGNCIYNLIVVPLLRQMIRQLLQQMTQRTIDWINGNNSSGRPSFVQNLQVNLQLVADSVALPLIGQFATAFNSPFGPAISAALLTNYTQQSSMAGFYAANQCTLPASSPNVSAFLAGNWSQGGVAAWLALTTQSQNNPFMLYETAQGQLNSVIGSATAARSAELSWGNGFLSWCKPSSSSTATSGTVTGSSGTTPATGSTQVASSASVVANPGDPCVSNGQLGTIQTPGTTIKTYLDKNLGSGVDQLVSAQDLDSALGAIVSALANRVISETGLLGSSQSSGSTGGVSVTGGGTTATQSSAASSAQQLAQSTLSNTTSYSGAWQTVSSAANTASASVTTLQNTCSAQSAAAQTALTNEIAPVQAQAQSALSSVAAATALANKVIAETKVVPIANPQQLSSDVSQLASMPPTAVDVLNAQSSAQSTGGSTAIPTGSLMVAGGSLVDQMNLISSNARALQASCTH